MRPTLILRMYAARLTLFTKSDCGLCDTAKARLAEVQKRRTVEYKEVDIMHEDNKKWFNAYCFDVPVLHINQVMQNPSKSDTVDKEKKLWHRFSEEEIERSIDEAEQQSEPGEG